MSAMPTSSWTGLLSAALAHDIGNLAQGLSSAQRLTRASVGDDFDAAEWATFVEGDVDRLRKLGVRLRALAAAGDIRAAARLDDACSAALAEVDPAGGQIRLVASPPADTRVHGPAAAVTVAIASLLEHARDASPAGAPIQLAIRGPAVVEIAAPQALPSGAIDRARLQTLLDTALRDRRGDFSLVLPGAVAHAIGGTVYFASDSRRGLVLELELVVGT